MEIIYSKSSNNSTQYDGKQVMTQAIYSQGYSVLKLGAELAHLLVRCGVVCEKVLLAVHVPNKVRPELWAVVEGLVGGQPQKLRDVAVVVLSHPEVVGVVELQPLPRPAAPYSATHRCTLRKGMRIGVHRYK